MKIIIAGCRWYYPEPDEIGLAMVAAGFQITEVVSGGAEGADKGGEDWAKRYGLACHIFKAHWAQYGKSAGPKRNAEMATYADGLLAFWDGKSRGTGDMIRKMTGLDKPVWIEMIQPDFEITEVE